MIRLLFGVLCFVPFLLNAQIYVNQNASGNNSGTSWYNAFRNLESAIESASTGDQIWVAQGTYFPADVWNGEGDGWKVSYLIDKDIEIYGGFAGHESILDARDWNVNITTLTGRIVVNGGTYDVNTIIQMKNVSNAFILDGFTIANGNASSGQAKEGGAIYNEASGAGTNSSPVIRNCIFENNQAFYGGAIYNYSNGGICNPILADCIFRNNMASDDGGAIYNYSTSSGNITMVMDRVFFDGNSAENGGAIFNTGNNGAITIIGAFNKFTNNNATKGGAVFSESSNFNGYVETVFNESEFENNRCDSGNGYGAAIYSDAKGGVCKPAAIKTLFKNNIANNYGAGMVNTSTGGQCLPTINACRFEGNISKTGAGIYNYGSDGNLTMNVNSTIFYNNNAQDDGAAIYNKTLNSSLISNVNNSTFSKNISLNGATVFYSSTDGSGWFTGSIESTVSNSIIWNDGLISSGENAYTLKVSNSIVKGTTLPEGMTSEGTNYLNYDPMFIDLANGDLTPAPCSPAIDNSTTVSSDPEDEDPDGRTRAVGAVDIGAVETQSKRELLETPDALFTATHEFTDPEGWTHYMDCAQNILLLSVKKSGQNIGTIGDGTFKVEILTTPNYATGIGTEISDANYVTSNSCYVMNRYWNVTPTHQPAAPMAVRFYFSEKDISDIIASGDNIHSIEDVFFFKVDNTDNPLDKTVAFSDYHEYSFSPTTASETMWTKGKFQGFDYAEYVVSSFSGGGGTTGSTINALPVELVKFTGRENDGGVLLKWATEAEMNSLGFEIHHKMDGEEWSVLTFKASAGESSTYREYTHQHVKALAGVHYYKLRAVDLDGTYEDSDMIVVTVNNEHFNALVYPNPVSINQQLKYNHAGAKLDAIFIFNNQGEQVYGNTEVGEFDRQIDLSEPLSVGIYQIMFVSGNKQRNQRFVVQE